MIAHAVRGDVIANGIGRWKDRSTYLPESKFLSSMAGQ